MMPFAALKAIGWINDMPAAFISALCAGVICFLLFLISKHYDIDRSRRIVMTLGVLFGTWMWTNLTMAGAWQLALGFAMVGELGAIYFTVYDRRPLIAGMFFALAFGNRTEVLLTAPIFFWFLWRNKSVPVASGSAQHRSVPPALAGGAARRRMQRQRTTSLDHPLTRAVLTCGRRHELRSLPSFHSVYSRLS
jgi:hypothetical protein